MSTAPHAPPRWRWSQVLQAPYRAGFLMAMLVLSASAAWWLLVQLDALGAGPRIPAVLPPGLVHAAVMGLGFMPLFFTGFLFTAAPRWLHGSPPTARALLPALLSQTAGWLLWLAGALVHPRLALAGLCLATGGLVSVTLRFWRLVHSSDAPDRLHARLIGWALGIGCGCHAGLAVALGLGAAGVARCFVLTGLWGFVVLTYVAVGHRMIPFFNSEALPSLHAWRPDWVLELMATMALLEAAAVWLEPWLARSAPLLLLRGALELAAGGLLLWLVRAWGTVRSLKLRLLAMLHLGALWFALALVLAGGSQVIVAVTGVPVLPLAALHALSMGCLGSLMLAMVSRVSCAHGGRAVVADNLLWTLFWLLQAAVLLRIAASTTGDPAMRAGAAALWATSMLCWAARSGSWYGRAPPPGG